MARYMTLLKFTAQGVRGIKNSPSRSDDFRKACRKAGVTVETLLWTVGAYDGVLIISAEDDQQALRMIVRLAAQGNVQTETLKALDAKEFASVAK